MAKETQGRSPHPLIPNTASDKRAMLETIGVLSSEELFSDIAPALRRPRINLPPAMTEMELSLFADRIFGENISSKDRPSFSGGGSQKHYIPSIVERVAADRRFLTAYTPYQAEISQGTLESAFVFQTMVCELYGMDVSNMGMYDLGSALGEAVTMTARTTGRNKVIALDTTNPNHLDVVKTYGYGKNLIVEEQKGSHLKLDSDTACVVVQSPNYFGYLEDLGRFREETEKVDAKLVVSADPLSLGMFKSPGEYSADIAVGDGQPFGIPMQFGGPSIGLFAVKQDLLRQIPGRIVGRTQDKKGKTGYVLTLQAREQFIRRERASSNICTSSQNNALRMVVALSALGSDGLKALSQLNYQNAHYAASEISQIPGFTLPIEGEFFNEFVVACSVPPKNVNRRLLEGGIIGGIDVSNKIENGMLFCVTEMNTKEDIGRLVGLLKKI